MNAPHRTDLVLTNLLLAALPRPEYERLAPHLHKVKLTKNSILYDTGEDVHDAYFVQSGVVSLVSITEDGENVEAGIVGSEGMIGIPSILRCRRSPFRAVVQIAGEALSIEARVLQREFKRGGELQDIVLCFTHTLVSQFAQAIVCNRFHTVEKRTLTLAVDGARPRAKRHIQSDTRISLRHARLGAYRCDEGCRNATKREFNPFRSRRDQDT